MSHQTNSILNFHVLLVDDDPESLSSTSRILTFEDHRVTSVSDAQSALQVLGREKIDLVITDVRMPGMNGMEFVEAYQRLGYKVPFVVMTAFGQVNEAVWAMKMGAVDFLLKPFRRQALLDAVDQVIQRMGAKTQGGDSPTTSFIGSSRAMRNLKVLIEQISKTNASVLLMGESGSGKEQVARLIHEKSSVARGPFIAVNCAAIPETLIESELFGYEKGAFSGAISSKRGLIESANHGTLLLDEIGDMPLHLQSKLLRVLEEESVRPVGSTSERKVKVRIIAATHQDLPALVKAQRFRQDLFYRLDVMTLNIPPLRERIEDIPELTQYFLSKFSKIHQKFISGIEADAQAALSRHLWPGNIRELSNVLERAVVLARDGLIRQDDLPPHLLSDRHTVKSLGGDAIVVSLGMSLKEIEDLMIKRTLEATGGDRAEAARLLGVNERTIYRKLSKNVEPEI